VIVFITPNHILYALPFFELQPEFICPASKPDCGPEDHCKDPKLYPINWDATRSLHNWVEQLNLTCADSYQIGLLGSSFFAGMTVLVVIVTRLGDVIGRKWPTNVSTVIAIPITVGLLFSKNLTLTIVLLFFFGATCPGREHVPFTYMCELVPERHRQIIGSVLLFADATTIGLIAVYFRFISKQWLYFQYFSLGLNLIATVVILFVPESPKYLHGRGSYQKAKDALTKIARFNKAQSYNREFKFVEELSKPE
jgi:MFS family permease